MFSSEQNYTGLGILDYRKQRFTATDILDGICTSETTDGRADTRIEVRKT